MNLIEFIKIVLHSEKVIFWCALSSRIISVITRTDMIRRCHPFHSTFLNLVGYVINIVVWSQIPFMQHISLILSLFYTTGSARLLLPLLCHMLYVDTWLFCSRNPSISIATTYLCQCFIIMDVVSLFHSLTCGSHTLIFQFVVSFCWVHFKVFHIRFICHGCVISYLIIDQVINFCLVCTSSECVRFIDNHLYII